MSDYQQLVQKALKLTNQEQNFAAALGLWQQALDQLGNDNEFALQRADLMVNAALCASRLNRHEEALEWCDQALEECAEAANDSSDEAQRVFAVLVDVAILAGDHDQAMEASELAFAALQKDSTQCSCYTLSMMAQKRALLARLMGQPDEAEEALAFAVEQLEQIWGGDDDELAWEATFEKARTLEIRAENRIQGGAKALAILDLQDAVKLYRRCDPNDVETRDYACGLLRGLGVKVDP